MYLGKCTENPERNVQWMQEVTLFHLIIRWIIIDIAYLFPNCHLSAAEAI